MKKSAWLLACAFLFYGAYRPVLSAAGALDDELEKARRFGRLLEGLREDLKIPGLSAAIVSGGSVLWAEGFGYADIDKKIKAAPKTSYYLASLTKPFASAIVLQLVEQGRLDLDAPAAGFGIHIHSPGTVTVRHLLSHSSEGRPGASYSYNGYRYQFLGQVILRASGRTLRDLVIDNILKPLGMTGTAPHPSGDAASDAPFSGVFERLTKPYGLDAEGRFVAGRYEDSFGAAAGLISNVLDMARFELAVSRNELLRPATWEAVFSPFVSTRGERLPYGLGWFTQDYYGLRLVWHYGYYGPSESTLILRVPQEKLALIVLANRDAMSSLFGMGDGDVLASPVAAAFMRTFVHPHRAGRPAAEIDWKSGSESLVASLAGEKDPLAVDLEKRELMARWRIYDTLGPKETAAGLTKAYDEAFPSLRSAAANGLPLIAEIAGAGDDEYRIVSFTLDRDTRTRVYGVGEGRPSGMFDFGGIEDAASGKLVWCMEYGRTEHAGGDASNRLAEADVPLPHGAYRLHFKTDRGHSFGRWTLFPPDHRFWGIALYDAAGGEAGAAAPLRTAAWAIPAGEITPSLRLLDSAPAGVAAPPGPAVKPALKLALYACGVVFLAGFIFWPAGAVIGFFERRRMREVPPSVGRRRPAPTLAAWLTAAVGLVYLTSALIRGSLEFLLIQGFDESQSIVRIFFLFLPLASAVLSVILVAAAIAAWRKGYRSAAGRRFFTLFTTASVVFVVIGFYIYFRLFS